MLTEKRVAEILESELRVCRNTIASGQEVLPHYVLMDEDGEVYIIATPWGEDEKRTMVTMVRLMALAHNCVRSLLVVEAWAVARPVESLEEANREINRGLAKPPSQCEDRIEMLTIIEQGDGIHRMKALPIKTENGTRSLDESDDKWLNLEDDRVGSVIPPASVRAALTEQERLKLRLMIKSAGFSGMKAEEL